jgi:hypothetical protein
MDKTINLISLKKVQSFCEKYFDERIFCHKFDVFFFDNLWQNILFICDNIFAKKLKENLKVLHNCLLQHERVFYFLIFEYCQILAKYSLWMIITQANITKLKTKTLLVLCICKQANNPIVGMRV